MLQAIRSRAGSVVVKLLFGALIVSFGIWGIGDIFRTEQSPDTAVATVGSGTVRADELQQALRPALDRLKAQLGRTVEPQQAKQLGIVDSVLGQLVDRKLYDEEARHLGLDVSDDVVRSAIYDNPGFRGADGKFDRSLFNQVLAVNRLSEDQFVAMIRRDVPRTDLLQAVVSGVVGAKPVVDAIYRYQQEKRIADTVPLPLAKAPDPGQPTADELTKFYDANQGRFEAPEYRGFTVASLAPADLEHDIKIPDDRLKQAFNDRQDEFQTPERRDVQQILAPSEEKIKEAAAALDKGEAWQDVATRIAGMNPDAIDLGLLKREEMPKLLSDIAFAEPVDKPSAPVESPLGWHILRVTKIDPGATQTLDEARPKLTAELQHEEAVDRIYKSANEIDDAVAGGAKLADVAAKYGLKIVTVAAADVGGRDPQGKPLTLPLVPADILKAAFSTGEGQTSRVAETQDNSIFVVHTDKIVAPHIRPLPEVKDQAIAAWQADKRREAVAKDAEEIVAKVKSGTPLATVAAEKGLAVTTSAPLMRRADPDAKLPPALIAQLFNLKPGDVVSSGDASGYYVAQLKAVQMPDTVPAAAADQGMQALEQGLQADLADEYTAALRRRFPVQINRAAIDKLF